MLLNNSPFTDSNCQALDVENITYPVKLFPKPLNFLVKNTYADNITAVLALVIDAFGGKSLIRKKDSIEIGNGEYSILTSKLAHMEAKWEKLNAKIAESMNMTSRIKGLEEGLQNLNNQVAEANRKMNGNMYDIHYNLDKEVSGFNNKFHEFKNDFNNKINDTNTKIQTINRFASTFELKIKKIGHIELMQNLDNAGLRIEINQKTLEDIRNEASNRIYGQAKSTSLNLNSTLWIITPESLPEKAGGLAEVPTEIAQNLKKLGIKAQTILPLYETIGVSRLTETENGYEYVYGLNTSNPSRFSLTKVVELEIPAYKDGKYKNQSVEILFKEASANEPDSIEKIYIKNSDYFKTVHMYKSTVTADEPERFAFFSKVVYEFMKLTADEKSQTCLRGFNKDAFSKIIPPDGVILNDWHCASIAALVRYKAPIEGHFRELEPAVSQKLKDMTIVNIIHNADYKGLSYENSSNMLNTLFDKYATDIYENALTGWDMKGLWNVLTLGDNDSACLANMGVCLSDTVVPVSETYAKELATQPERSGWMQHVFAQRYNHGTMKGILNGWDLSSKQVNDSTISELNNLLNSDKVQICNKRLKESFGNLEFADKKEALKILNDKDKDFKSRLKALKKINKSLKETIKVLKKEGYTSLRKYKTYTQKDSSKHIFKTIKYNRIQTLDYLKSIIQYDAEHLENSLFGVVDAQNTDISYINNDNLDKIPILGMAARFVSQKGIDILAMTIQKLNARWEEKFQDMPRPLFLLGGQDYESGRIRNILRNAQKSIGENSKYIIYVDGFAPGSVYQAGCTHYLYPSWFEPCGSQAEAMGKGCVPIATKVGGLADMIEDNETGYLTNLSEKDVIEMAHQNLYNRGIDPHSDINAFEYEKTNIMSDSYLEQIENALCDFYYNQKKYKEIAINALNQDFSWITTDEKGRIQGSLNNYLQEFEIKLD